MKEPWFHGVRCGMFRRHLCPALTGALLATLLLPPALVDAAGMVLKNGTELEGAVGQVSTMVPSLSQAPAGEKTQEILFVDNELTRVYFSFNQVKQTLDQAGPPQQVIQVPNKAAQGGNPVAGLGAFGAKPTPIDQFGQRRIVILLDKGPADIVQGMTKITPLYFQLKTMPVGRMLLLDQRYATSNLTSEQILAVLRFAMKDKKPDVRKSAVRLLLQADRYAEAKIELELLKETYPQMEGLSDMLRDLQQLRARTALVELRRRQDAGQPATVRRALQHFPTEGVDGQILAQVRAMIKQDLDLQQEIESLRSDLRQRMEKVSDDVLRKQLGPTVEEISGELNLANLPRLSAYRRLSSDAAMKDPEKLALAISGWLLGADDAMPNLRRAQSLMLVRGYILDYLRDPLQANRDKLLAQVRSQESGTVELVARLLAAMKPPVPLPDPTGTVPGYYELSIPAREDGKGDVAYTVQLPPEYDPYRRYPVVVSLHGQTTTPAVQIDWWAGHPDEKGVRSGQATRQGYIVIAPQWGLKGQYKYEYSAREHLAVLDTLRDACRRFSIDTDRVYLSGHAMGGDAAWDMALAHPDLWAGAIPIVATADTQRYSYCKLYWQNAQYVPLYFVGGEYDGAKRAKNGPLLDRYLRASKCDTMVVEYLGRGHENFSDDVVRIFDWMGRHKRNFFPKSVSGPDFECGTLRSYDNFFWWVEINKFQKGVTVDPGEWPGRGPRTLKITGKITEADQYTTVHAATGKSSTTIWLSPELVDFKKRIRVNITGRPEVSGVRPDLTAILEDVRTRGDRQHPFWARVDFP